MKIVENILTSSPCYKAGKTITPKGLMMHSVGVPQPNASVFVNTFSSSTNACVHAVMGADGVVHQILPWNRRAWHAGSPANDMFISIELTEPSSISYIGGASFKDNNHTATKTHVDATYKHAVEFAAYICQKYNFDPTNSNQLLSHSEGYKKGYATNHADVEHLWGKYGHSMDQFRKDVKAVMAGGTVSGGASSGGSTSSGTTYTVVKGDTLTSIAKKYGMTLTALISLNPQITDANKISVGQIITVSGTASNNSGSTSSNNGNGSIKTLQTELNNQGFANPKLVVDNKAGAKTLAACPTVKQGAKGNITKWIQVQLGVSADGIFGNDTLAAVKAYQKMKGLSADGIIGKNTWKALLGL